ncbi:hypothetical protein AX17_007295 [Amanita inopinata Kibby_2008]|nr:hypothetical protein AX17_007295 [Amanita inopinata Kibby_2008]
MTDQLPLSPPYSPSFVSRPTRFSLNLGALGAGPHLLPSSVSSASSISGRSKERTMVLCFDGTGNKFGTNSNVVRFFRALIKDRLGEQVVYYQPGIGTYNKRAFITHTMNTISSALDAGIALHLDDHVKEGYQFIMQNYREGDKICLFGFSRGAHTARVIAGMLYKVGILPRHNIEQVDFAFNIYSTTGYKGYLLSKEFKETFALPVKIKFVGVWDTVSSVGIIPRTHPYTSINYSVETFRHALALDERRARFRPNVWCEVTPDREQELDVDIPNPKPVGETRRDEWTYNAPDRNYVDVEEVWFAGCHADVGGGSHPTTHTRSVSYIPLRWMIKECIIARTGIQFDMDYLSNFLGFNFKELAEEMKAKGIPATDLGYESYADIAKLDSSDEAHHLESEQSPQTKVVTRAETRGHHLRRHVRDVCAQIFDQLVIVWFWWILEVIPMLYTYQTPSGNWVRRRMRNLGRGRYIPFYNNEIRVHESVQARMKAENYTPSANNWEQVNQSPMLKYVK